MRLPALLVVSLLAFGPALGCNLFLRGDDENGNGNGVGNGNGNGTGNGSGNGNGNGEIVCPGDPGCPPEAITIQDVRDPIRRAALPAGPVTVEGLVVTAVRTRMIGGEPHFDTFVQDPAGGPWSAIELAALTSAPALGDVLTVSGTHQDYFGQDRLIDVTVEVTGTAALPGAAHFADPGDIATGGDDAYPFQSALIRIEDVTVIDDRVLGTDGNWRGDFRVTGDLVVGRIFPHDYMPENGDSLLSVTGVLVYGFGESRLQPRDNDDVVVSGGTPAGPDVVSIYELRAYEGDLSGDGRLVRVEDVVVTAISVPDNRGRRNLFVQEEEGGAESGVYLFNQPDFDVTGYAVGDRVSLEGRHTRRSLPGDTVTHDQISLRSLERLGPGTPLQPVLVDDPADLVDPEKGADAWVGVLLQIEGVTVTAGPNQYGEVELAAAPKLAPVLMGTAVLADTEPDDYFESVTGILQWRFGYALLPRGASDVIPGDAPLPPEPEIVAISDVRDPEKRAELGPGPYTVDGIVTAVRPRSNRFDVFIQADDAGIYDGIMVPFVTPAPEPGDRIRATGQYEDFYGYDRLASATYEVLESGLPEPTPILVSPATIATGSADAFAYQSLLLQVADVTVVDDRVLGTDGVWRGDFEVDGGLVVGRWFSHGYEAVEGDAFETITGVLRYSFDAYVLEPRQSDDLVLEEGEVPDPDPEPVPLAVTIPQLQDESHEDHPELGTWVEVSEAVVTGVRVGTRADLTTYVDGFTIQTPATTGPHHGIYVYTPSRPPPEDIGIQDRVRVRGDFTTFLNMTQIEADEIEHLGVADALPAPQAIDDPAIFDDASAIRPWLGVLVRVEKTEGDLEVTEGTDAYGEYWIDGVMRIRNFLYDHETTTGDLFTSITGVVGYFETFSGQVPGYRLWPRVAEDLETP
jgi:hypothetical protein